MLCDDAALAALLRKGKTHDGHRAFGTGEIATGGKSKTGSMSAVAVHRFSVLTDAEVAALKLYLDSR